MEAQEKELTRQEKIEDLQTEYDRRKARAVELGKQLNELLKGLAQMDRLKAREIEKTLDSLPDASPKAIVDKILQLPSEKRSQLLSNIDKIKIAIMNEERKAKQTHDEIDRLKNEILQKEINDYVRDEVFMPFEEFIRDYKSVREKFLKLKKNINAAYDLDKLFFQRGEKMGLNKNMVISVQSHFRRGENLGMEETVEKILFMGDVQNTGKPLLERYNSDNLPDNHDSYFGFKESDRAKK